MNVWCFAVSGPVLSLMDTYRSVMNTPHAVIASAAYLVATLATVPATASAAVLPGAVRPSAAVDDQAAAQLTRGYTVPTKSASTTALGKLRVAADGPMTGYSREKFPHWLDASTWGWPVAPSNSCNARQAALYRDGTGVKVNSSCTPTAGKWLDPYTSAWLTDATKQVQIDHIVPLADAWRTGAAKWTDKQRRAYANAPLVLAAVSGTANSKKGDASPDAWKPANKASHCLYAKRWITIKTTYALTINPTEKTALTSMLGTCTS